MIPRFNHHLPWYHWMISRFYLESLEALHNLYDDKLLNSQMEILALLEVKNMSEQLTTSLMIFICTIVLISIILLKMIDSYHLRFSQVLLESNGISVQKIRKTVYH